MNWIENPTAEQLAELAEATKKRGGKHDETTLSDCGWERDRGYIEVYCGRGADCANLIKRCGSKVLAYRTSQDEEHLGVWLRIDRSAFRGISSAFKNVDNKQPMTETQRQALRLANTPAVGEESHV